MNNYEYILACLQEPDFNSASLDTAETFGMIRSLLEGRDLDDFSLLESYYADEGPCEEFYRTASKSRCRFIREWSAFDREMRNTKVAWLNSRLGRPEMSDIVRMSEGEEPAMNGEALAALQSDDTLERERSLDLLMWNKAASLTELENFSLDRIISCAVRLKITERWLRLDKDSGRAMLRKLVEEIKNTTEIYD